MMIDSLFFKELPLKMGAHICGIDWFHIHFIGVKIGIFPFVSKPGIPSPVLSAKQPHRKVPCVRNVDGCGAPMPDIGPWRTRWGVLYVHGGCRCAAGWREDDVRMDEIPRRCACGISVPPAGVRATPLGSCSRRSFGPLVCFRYPSSGERAPRPPDNKNSQLLAQPAA